MVTEECRLKKNRTIVDDADAVLGSFLKMSALSNEEYREAWDMFWGMARRAEPCQCAQCVADRVMRQFDEADERSFVELIAQDGVEFYLGKRESNTP